MKKTGNLFLAAAMVLSSMAGAQVRTLDHYVAVDTVRTAFTAGDNITIEEVRGTSDSIEAGNLYEVRGSYTLNSRSSAVLAAYTTTTADDQSNAETMSVQKMTVDHGSGTFVLYLYMWRKGFPHVSFYPAGNGGSFGGVYFGTGDSSPNGVSWIRKANGRTDKANK